MRMPGYPPGVRSQYEVHVHPWPTRFHGPIYTRPMFTAPYVQSPQAVFKPDDFSSYYEPAQAGIGTWSMDFSVSSLIAGFALGAVTVYLLKRKR